MGAEEEEEDKRDVGGRNLCAASLLVACLLFYQAFWSRPSAPRRLICQMGFHLRLEDATNLPPIPASPHGPVCQHGSKSSSATWPAENRQQQRRTSAGASTTHNL